MSPTEGTTANSQVDPAREAGVDYVNNKLGGLRGHQVQIVNCVTDGTPEKAISCANSFVQAKVLAVLDLLDPSAGSAYPILASAGIPIVGGVAQNAVTDVKTPDAVNLQQPDAAYAIGPMQLFHQMNVKKLSLADVDTPTNEQYIKSFVAPIARELGISFTPVFYESAAANYSLMAASLLAVQPDLTGMVDALNPGQCQAILQAIRQDGFKGPLLAGPCDTTGPDAVGAIEYSASWQPEASKYASPVIQKELSDTTVLLQKYVNEDSSIGSQSYHLVGQIVTFALGVNSVKGPLTSASILSTLKGLKNFPAFLGPNITCNGSIWPDSDACTDQLLLLQVQADGSLKPTGAAGFYTVSPSLLPK
jgi:branched-chain amino acid transport system substrate-binding protein